MSTEPGECCGGYAALGGVVTGPSVLHLDLTVAQRATDGLLAIFFFVVGLKLKREVVDGQLRRLSTALRAFLLTLAVVDDLLGVVVIAVFYAETLYVAWRGSAGLAVPVFASFAAGVAMSPQALATAAGNPAAQGVALGLVAENLYSWSDRGRTIPEPPLRPGDVTRTAPQPNPTGALYPI